MPISEDLKQIYSNYEDDRAFYDTVQLYHPNFKVYDGMPYPSETKYPSETLYPTEIDFVRQSYFLVRNIIDMELELEDGTPQTFSAFPFNVIQPQVGESQQDVGIILDNVSVEMVENIEVASKNFEQPIIMTFTVYMEGDLTPQITPIEMALTEIVIDMYTVSCKASRVDLFRRKFPWGANTYYDSKFKGLLV